jgi:hypothetical protein
MSNSGAFGFIIGRKKRIIKVHKDADLLWQLLVREIYILMKHFKTLENMRCAFEKIKTTKSSPKLADIEKLKIFTTFEEHHSNNNNTNDWAPILHYCQSSFINILESGYILNQNVENGLIFILDFNKGNANYYSKDLNGKIINIQSASIKEIMSFEDMPTKTYPEIVLEMRTNFVDFYEKYAKIEEELNNLKKLKEIAKTQNASNIEDKVDKLIDDMNWEKKKLNASRRVFYHRLKALDLIEDAL